MTPDLLDLGRRAVACAGWRWLPGMLTMTGHRVVDVACAPLLKVWRADGEGAYEPGYNDPPDPWLPDISDPATLGCLLALVREAWGSTAHLVRYDTWVVGPTGDIDQRECWWALATGLSSVPLLRPDGAYLAGPTEAKALVAALEAA